MSDRPVLSKLTPEQLRGFVEFHLDEQANERLSRDQAQRQVREALSQFRKLRMKSPAFRIKAPPGYLADNVLEFIYTRKAYERVFKPHIRDMRDEHAAALAVNRLAKARWIVLRDHLRLVMMIGSHAPGWVIKLITEAAKSFPL